MPYAQWIPMLVTACAMTVTSAGCSAGLSRPTPAPDFALTSVAAKAQPVTAPRFVNRFSALVQQNGPAVVNISSIQKEQIANAQSLWPPAASEHDPFRSFSDYSSPRIPLLTRALRREMSARVLSYGRTAIS